MKHSFTLAIFSLSSLISLAQEEDASCLAPDKKVVKMIETAKNAPDAQTAVINFTKAIDAAPDNATAYFEFGVYAYNQGKKAYENNPNPAVGDKSWARAEELFEKAAEICYDFHSDMYYFLGVINYTQEDKDAATKWFQKFVEFKNDDMSRFGADYANQLKDVKEVLKLNQDEKELMSTTVPFNPFLVKNVSSAEDEYFPMISPDNLFMFYTRKVGNTEMDGFMAAGTTKEVYTYSERKDETIDFTKGTAFKAPFNKGDFDSYGAATMSVDNKEMIICACKRSEVRGQSYMNCDLYSTTFEKIGPNPNDYQWTDLTSLGSKINTPDGWEGQPSLTADGQTLFFTANRATTDDNDVFIVKRNPDGTWGTPEPFAPINTKGKDKSPFMHQDSETLYFVSTCSESRKGAGGLDIFYMREENGTWSEPKNIGIPINTKEDELGVFVSTDGKLAYFSSRQNGNWNIYGFELYEEARPKPVTILKGELKDEQGAPITDASIEIAYQESDKVETVKVNGNDGKFAVVVKQEKPQDIMVSVKKEGAAYDAKLVTKEDLANKTTRNNNQLAVKELKVGEAYTINDILYDYNSDALSDRSKFVIRNFARYLEAHPEIKISILGHTDSDGDDTKNMDLSDRRAKGVKAYLVSLGIDESRLEAKGLGETQPKAPNDTAANKAKNRRTEFKIEAL